MSRDAVVRFMNRIGPVWLVALGAIGVALVWTILHLGDRSLWFDELFTIAVAAPDTPDAEAFGVIAGDVHPPLYYAGARAWLGLLGTSSEWALRAFNLFGFAFAVAGAAWATRVKVDAPMAIWSALFFTSFGMLWYLQEARMYAFLICESFLVCVVALGYEKLKASKPSPFFIAATVVTFVVLPFMHWFAALFAGIVLFGLFVLALLDGRRAYAALFFGAGVLLGGLAVLWIGLFYGSTVGALDNYSSGAGLEAWQLRDGFFGSLLFAFTLNPLLIAAAGWAAVRVLRAPLQRPPLTLLLLCAGVVPLLILAASFYSPVNQTRNFVGFIGPGTLLAALGVTHAASLRSLTPRGVAAALAALLAVSFALGLFADRLYPKLERDAWREAGAYVRALPGCADATIPMSVQWARRPTDPALQSASTTRRKFAYYAGGYERFAPVYADDTRLPDAAGAQTCPVVFWVGHIGADEADVRARELLGPAFDDVDLVYLPGNALFVRKGAPTP